MSFLYLVILVAFLFSGLSLTCSLTKDGNTTLGCFLVERNALLKFKASFSDPSRRLLSWNSRNTDCCKWKGVQCDKITRHVIGVDLRNENLSYPDDAYSSASKLFSEALDSSIVDLKHLSFLDLSGNDFQLNPIPVFIGSMNQLQYLNLSSANLNGVIPHHLGNLSRLSVLDLNGYYDDFNKLVLDDFLWVIHLSSLTHLDMSSVDLTGTRDLLKVLNMLPSIVTLRFQSCGLNNRNLPHTCVTNSTRFLPNIQYLDLSKNFYDGEIPCFLENMTSLVNLDLSYNDFQYTGDRIFKFIPNNCNLESLNLGLNSFTGDISNFFRLNSSKCLDTKLAKLDLSENHFYGQLPEEIGGFTKLEHLDLDDNLISGPIPTSFSNLSGLKILSLYSNKLSGSIPSFFANLTSLIGLSLNNNQLSGSIPSSFFTNLTSLTILYLQNNQLSGEIPTSLGQLQNLESLYINDNHFHGTISESHFTNLSKLEILYLGGDLTKLRVGSDWTPPFQLLRQLWIDSCEIVGGQFPKWLQTQKELTLLRMSNCSLTGSLPDWLWQRDLNLLYLPDNRFEGSLPDSLCEMNHLEYLDLSRNGLSGNLPECLANLTSLFSVYLSSNRFSGVIPKSIGGTYSLEWLQLSNNSFTGELPSSLRNCTQLFHLDIGQNKISGRLPKWIGTYLLHLEALRLTHNEFYGTIPSELCHLSSLKILDLANNKLTGNIPRCFGNFSDMIISQNEMNHLKFLYLSSNRFSGVIPKSIGGIYSLISLQLSNNSFTGELPSSLRNCTQLRFLDIGQNKISGILPKWIGTYLLNLEALRLTHNEFYGTIPSELCHLSSLKILDLANNKLTGNIPRCFGNFSGMIISNLSDMIIYNQYKTWFSMQEVMKGTAMEYSFLPINLVNIDLSNNDLVGEIPLELTRLVALNGLNLAHNHLRGLIPGRIGDMKRLESLDLSNNNLSGNIPVSLSDLDSLSFLNLSHNNLSGEIPTGRHFQTLDDPWRYKGNPGLCGPSLLKKCHGDKARGTPSAVSTQTDDEEEKADRIWFYGVVISGFATGFWSAIGVLMFKRDWRFAYFKFADDIICRILGR